jgi:hypothetical protein
MMMSPCCVIVIRILWQGWVLVNAERGSAAANGKWNGEIQASGLLEAGFHVIFFVTKIGGNLSG